jgi:hypothetical protein
MEPEIVTKPRADLCGQQDERPGLVVYPDGRVLVNGRELTQNDADRAEVAEAIRWSSGESM